MAKSLFIYFLLLCMLMHLTVVIADEKILEFNLCHTPKHCIKCAQLNFEFGPYYAVPDQESYMKSMIDGLNNFRSWYAHEYEIGNMRFAKWNFELFSLAEDTATFVGGAELTCLSNSTIRHNSVVQQFHSLADFTTSIKDVLDRNSTNHAVYRQQFNLLINQAINSSHLVKYNMNEFGCSYTFKPLSGRTVFLIRCLFYVDPNINEGEMPSINQCSTCSEWESCITAKYPGLCVPTNSTEKYVKKLLESDPDDSFAGSSMIPYIKYYFLFTAFLFILCEVLLINII